MNIIKKYSLIIIFNINMYISTRFAPSPTGVLHLGNIRTALFNWIFARANQGKFFIRIEDTDKIRSNNIYTQSILNYLKFFGIDWNYKVLYQSRNTKRHRMIAEKLLDKKNAYYCNITHKEIVNFYKTNPGKKFNFKNRNLGLKKSSSTVLRFKTSIYDSITIKDLVMGNVTMKHSEIDDMVLLRSNNTPTYLLSSTIDDHDMSISHIIRGSDHLTNTFRQYSIIKALNWPITQYAHLPLLLNKEGQKLSKRTTVMDIDLYVKQYLPEALCNFLLKLGWSSKNIEIIKKLKIIKIFKINNINKTASRLNQKKLHYINKLYIKNANHEYLIQLLKNTHFTNWDKIKIITLKKCLPFVKIRSETISDLYKLSQLFIKKDIYIDKKIFRYFNKNNYIVIKLLLKKFIIINNLKLNNFKKICEKFTYLFSVELMSIIKLLRLIVFGTFNSPPILQSLTIINKKTVFYRIKKITTLYKVFFYKK